MTKREIHKLLKMDCNSLIMSILNLCFAGASYLFLSFCFWRLIQEGRGGVLCWQTANSLHSFSGRKLFAMLVPAQPTASHKDHDVEIEAQKKKGAA